MADNSFVIIIPAFNAIKKIEKTIKSLINQSYENWRAYVIDDMSTDSTYEFLLKIKDSKKYGDFSDKITIIKRSEKFGETRNVHDIVTNHTRDNEIIVRVDSGDWIIEQDTLAFINETINKEKIQLGWTQHRWGYNNIGISGPYDLSVGPYEHRWVSSHMKFFKSELFKRIPIENLKNKDGEWIMIACDQAIFLPMIHIAREKNIRFGYLDFLAYHYDIDLTDKNLFLSDRSIRQKESAEWIRERGFISR